MSISIYAATVSDRSISPVIDFDCWDEQILVDNADEVSDEGGDPWIANPKFVPNAGMNLSNANARFLMEEIGLPLDDQGMGLFPIDDVLNAALIGLNGPAASASRPTLTTRGELGATIVDCGTREGYMASKLVALAALVAEGRKHGATHISVA